ncbi:GNAT family N-acetyltransferase [Vaginella massiliensis]|uniref:GNAT family N-acetyltransferase n=1 Tax=Vaginella massiliensis TaxID=1816680 RepID=UPI000839697D|nr:GNAT family N-acetyltransferase [Vaginella massiliensis]
MSVSFKKEINGNKGEFIAISNEQQVGFVTFSVAGEDKIIIDHTEVQKQFKGEGIGAQLIEFAVNDARNNHYKISPLCPFAKAEFEKHSEYQDVLA